MSNIAVICAILASIGIAHAWLVHKRNARGRQGQAVRSEIARLRREIQALDVRRTERLDDRQFRPRAMAMAPGLVPVPPDKIVTLEAAVAAPAVLPR